MKDRLDEIQSDDSPAYKAVATQIERLVASGKLRPGDALPNETALADRFGVNRSTIRESLRLLEDTGYVRRISPRKLIAAMPEPASLVHRTLRALCTNRVTIREVYETNLCLEPRLARYAADRANISQVEALAENVAATRNAFSKRRDLSQLDEAFHRTICEASNQKAMLFALEPYRNKFQTVVNELGYSIDADQRLVTAHSRIFEAIARHDGEVAELWTRRHLEDFERGCALASVDMDRPIEVE